MECLICFELINENSKYTMCSFCNIKVHTSCYKAWQKKSRTGNTCILCRQNGGLVRYNKTSCFSCIRNLFYRRSHENYVSLPDK
jgi:hypothetical protein